NPSGHIASHNYPYPYPNHELCTWTLSGPSNVYYVISISYMDIESSTRCQYAALNIYDGASERDTQQDIFCGRNYDRAKIVSSLNNYMHIVFKTNYSG
ncbi:unnamed protein product, partial [Lymnaea stagnalis]